MSEEPVEPMQAELADPLTDRGQWLPEGRSLRDELIQPRYLIAAAFVLLLVILQIWVLF